MATLEEMMEIRPKGKKGVWCRCSDMRPPRYGEYEIIRRGRAGRYNLVRDRYLWNGGSWVTHAFNLSKAVEAWFMEE